MSEHDLLAGRHAVVTGGGRGIGSAIADTLAAMGARISLVGRDGERLAQKSRALPQAQGIVADISDETAVEQAFSKARAFGAIDILVNNAGQAESGPFGRMGTALWRQMLAVNLDGVFFCTRAALPDMQKAGWGRIINIASTAGLKGYPYVTAYCAAKHGVIGLTRALALELARSGITVNAVCPGYTETDIVQTAIENIVAKTGRSAEQARAQLTASNPQGRLVQPYEVAAAIAWLCRPGSDAITGQAIAVASGEIM